MWKVVLTYIWRNTWKILIWRPLSNIQAAFFLGKVVKRQFYVQKISW